MFQIFAKKPLYPLSAYNELPRIDYDSAGTHGRFLVILGGITLVLSRSTPEEVRAFLPSTSLLLRQIRSALGSNRVLGVSRPLICSSFGEVRHISDPLTIDSYRWILDRSDPSTLIVRVDRSRLQPVVNSKVPAADDDTIPIRELSNTIHSKLTQARNARARGSRR